MGRRGRHAGRQDGLAGFGSPARNASRADSSAPSSVPRILPAGARSIAPRRAPIGFSSGARGGGYPEIASPSGDSGNFSAPAGSRRVALPAGVGALPNFSRARPGKSARLSALALPRDAKNAPAAGIPKIRPFPRRAGAGRRRRAGTAARLPQRGAGRLPAAAAGPDARCPLPRPSPARGEGRRPPRQAPMPLGAAAAPRCRPAHDGPSAPLSALDILPISVASLVISLCFST